MEIAETPPSTHAAVFPLLADPDGYVPHTVDLMQDAAARDYWIDVFVDHLPSLVRYAVASDGGNDDAQRRGERLRERFAEVLDTVRRTPDAFGHLSILNICYQRERCLRESGFADPYAQVKAAENDAALELLPGLLGELDAMPDGARLEEMIRGAFAGNIFDLGACASSELYEDGGIDFHAVRDQVQARPWCIDDFDALAARWAGPPHRKAVVFVDNAGADVVLGMTPIIRELARRGTTTIVTSNDKPALNDITHDAIGPLMRRVAAIDPAVDAALRDGRITLIGSGNDAPLIDLRRVRAELAAAAADADLVVLEGMGRAVETNLHAAFTCDALKLAMLKERQLAELLGGELYDVVCRFEPIG